MKAATLLCALLALAPPQEPAAPPTLGELMRRLRAPDADWLAREAAVDLLIEHHGAEGARQAARYALDRLEADAERWQRSRERYLKRFDKAAPAAVPARREKGAEQEIARLRAECAAVSAREPLEKSMIVDEVDPRLARLGELLLVVPGDVLEWEQKLAAEREELVAACDAACDWWETWRRAADGWIRHDPEAAGAGAGPREEAPAHPDPWLDALAAAEDWSCVLATPMTERDRANLLANRAEAETGAHRPDEAEGILLHNRMRIQLGLHAQRVDSKLCAAGRDHSKDMKELGFFAHESPVPGKKSPGDRAANFGTSAGAENIAAGMRAPRDAILAWWHSPGHHKNMLGGADRIGLGHFDGFWTEMFG